MRICVFDSGIGGLPFVQAVNREFPFLEIDYVADDAGFPYGTKSPEMIRDILFERFRRIRARIDPEVLILSCMTAVQIGLRELQAAHRTLQIIGAIPPIAEAANESQTHRIALLATSRTTEDSFLDYLIARDAPDCEVIRIPAQDLIEYAEQRLPFASKLSAQTMVAPYINYALKEGTDRIVLASSQFILLEDSITNQLNELQAFNVKCLDPRGKVICSLQKLIPDKEHSEGQFVKPRFYLTGDQGANPSLIAWSERFNCSKPQLL